MPAMRYRRSSGQLARRLLINKGEAPFAFVRDGVGRLAQSNHCELLKISVSSKR
jgi:hypothetical protein